MFAGRPRFSAIWQVSNDCNRRLETQLSTQRSPAGRTVEVFFRDDDADDDLPNLHRLLDLFLGCSAPISLAVIPGTLTGSGRGTSRTAA